MDLELYTAYFDALTKGTSAVTTISNVEEAWFTAKNLEAVRRFAEGSPPGIKACTLATLSQAVYTRCTQVLVLHGLGMGSSKRKRAVLDNMVRENMVRDSWPCLGCPGPASPLPALLALSCMSACP